MNAEFVKSVENSTAHRPSRDYHSDCVFGNPALLNDLMTMALNTQNPFHYKACWILELILEKHISWLLPNLDAFCDVLPLFTHDGALRSVSKICLFSSKEHLKTNEFLSNDQIRTITECSFDWLISDKKVATKAYSMRTLFELGKLEPWIYPELKPILQQDAAFHSAAYKAAGKDILRRIR